MRVRQALVAFLEPQFQQRLADCAAGILKDVMQISGGGSYRHRDALGRKLGRAPLTIREIDIGKQLKWVERLWNCDGKTVTQVVTELNRHNDLKIDFDKSALRADTVI